MKTHSVKYDRIWCLINFGCRVDLNDNRKLQLKPAVKQIQDHLMMNMEITWDE